jgi:starch-binding outer membrane protein SusE/F
MKKIKIIASLAFVIITLAISSCKKDPTNRSILAADPGAPALTVDKAMRQLDPNSTTDSALLFTWSKGQYGFDAMVSYSLECATTQEELGDNSKTAKVFTAVKTTFNLLSDATLFQFAKSAGIAPNDSADVYFRVKSFLTNNPSFKVLKSNVVKVNMKRLGIATPTTGELYLVGDADSIYKWSNPNPNVPNKLVKINDYKYGGVFYLQGGKEYLLLPACGFWDTKYCLVDGGKANAGAADGGIFTFKTAGGDNFPAPATSGWYKIELDFGTGSYSVTPMGAGVADYNLPKQLWAVGDATPQGWNNAPTDAQKATQINCNQFTYSQDFTDITKQAKFVSVNGQWQPQFGMVKDMPGKLGANFGAGSDPETIKPSVTGVQTLTLDFYNWTYQFNP